MKTTPDQTAPRHPIRVAAERAGLTTEVLRAWERRYEVVKPGRDDSGQRLYSDSDIDRLSMLARLSRNGRAVGSLVGLPSGNLQKLVAEDAAHQATIPSDPALHRTRAIAAARAMDSAGLFAALRRAVLSMGTPALLDEVLHPLIAELGNEWHAERIGIAREHAATATIEQLLGWVMRELGSSSNAPRLLLAAPTGERHALGSMIAATMASHDEWHCTWLGVDLPADQIAAAAQSDGSIVVALGLVATDDAPPPRAEVEALRALLPERVPLLLGGSGAAALADVNGVTVVENLTHWRTLLHMHTPASHG